MTTESAWFLVTDLAQTLSHASRSQSTRSFKGDESQMTEKLKTAKYPNFNRSESSTLTTFQISTLK